MYKKLTQLITEHRNSLDENLRGRKLPSEAEEIKRKCIDYICSLTSKDTEYMNQLSLLEQDLLAPVLKVMDTLYTSDIELSQKICFLFSDYEKSNQNKPQSSSKVGISKEYGPALVGAAGGTLLATICRPSSWGVILFGSVISAIIGKVLYSLYIDKNDSIIAHVGNVNYSFPEYELTHTDVDNIVKGLVTAGECIDRVLLTYRRHLDIFQNEYSHKIESFNLDKKYIGILECYQTVLGNMYLMESSLVVEDTIKQICNSLSVQGYKAIHYSEELKNLFNIKTEEGTDIEEFKPAIVKVCEGKETLIIKGEVVLPA